MQTLEEFIAEYLTEKLKEQTPIEYLIDKRGNWLNDSVIKKVEGLEEKLSHIDEVFKKDVYLKFIINAMIGNKND
jgi:molybdopterin converting factor small subunit